MIAPERYCSQCRGACCLCFFICYFYPIVFQCIFQQTSVVFFDLVSLEAHTKTVSNLKFIAASGDLCALIICEKNRSASITGSIASIAAASAKGGAATAKDRKDRKGGDDSDDDNNSPKLKAGSKDKSPVPEKAATVASDVYTIQLRNAIGAVVDTKVLPFIPKHISMSSNHVTVSNDRTVFAWQFQSQVARSGLVVSSSTSGGSTSSGANGAVNRGDTLDDGMNSKENSNSRAQHQSKVRMFDIANTSFTTAQSPETFQIISEAISDPISCTTISDKFLVVGRKNGSITRFQSASPHPREHVHFA